MKNNLIILILEFLYILYDFQMLLILLFHLLLYKVNVMFLVNNLVLFFLYFDPLNLKNQILL